MSDQDPNTAPAEGSVGTRRSSLRARLLLVLITTIIALLVAEGLSRIVAPVPLHATDTFLAANTDMLQADSAPVWLRPSVDTSHEGEDFTISVRTNSKGLRDGELPYRKPDGETRILSLGDSFAFGYGVELADSYCKVAEADLGPPWRAINAGVPSWGTADELDYLIAEGLRFEPDVVVLCFFENDFRDNWVRKRYRVLPDGGVERLVPIEEDRGRRTQFDGTRTRDPLVMDICERGAEADWSEATPPKPEGPGWLAAHSNLYRLGRQALSTQAQLEALREAEEAKMQFWLEQRDLASALLREVARVCSQRRLPFILLLMPEKNDIRKGQVSLSELRADVTAAAEAEGAVVVDLAGPIQAAGGPELYFEHDDHINAAGHEVVGRELAAAVRRLVAP